MQDNYEDMAEDLQMQLDEAEQEIRDLIDEVDDQDLEIKQLEKRLKRAYSERNYAAILATRAVAAYGAGQYASKCGWYCSDEILENDCSYYVSLKGDTGRRVTWNISSSEVNLAKESLREIDINWAGVHLSEEASCVNVINYDPKESDLGSVKSVVFDLLLSSGPQLYDSIYKEVKKQANYKGSLKNLLEEVLDDECFEQDTNDYFCLAED